MSLFDCIERAVDAGEMDQNRAAIAQRLVRQLEERYAQSMGPEAAAAAAAADAKKILRQQTERRRRLMLKQVQTARRLHRNISDYRNLAGEANAADALPALFENDQAARFESVDQIRGALRGRYHRMMGEFLKKHARNVIGQVKKKADLDNLVREMHGEGTGDIAAQEMALAVRDTLDQARRDFNAAGGDIGKLDDFGVPHSHDAERIRAGGGTRAEQFEAWRAAIDPELDWQRIRDFETDLPFDLGPSQRKTEFLRAIFDDVLSDGWNRREPGFVAQGLSTANSRADARVLHFRDGSAWLRYNRQYGRSDPFAVINTHLDGLARDTALMRVLGPNPKAGFEFARQTAEKQAKTAGWKMTPTRRLLSSSNEAEVATKARLAENMLALLSGAANEPVNDKLASFLAGTRNVLTSAHLGSAMIGATTDVGFQAMAARHLGMPAGRVIARQAKLLASEGARDQALRAGVIADQLANVGVAQARLNLDATGPEITERLAEATMRLSGLTAWTEAGRHAFQLEMMGFLADQTSKTWDELPDPIRSLFLEARGFDADQWDIIRSTELHRDPSGATFLVPDDIRHRTDIDADQADGLALRLMGAIQEQAEFAIPSQTLRGRASVGGAARPGSVIGELSRSVLMYKNFALTIMFRHLRRYFLASVNGTRAGNIAMFFGYLTLMGAAAVQLKEVAKGRDPRDMTTAKFLGAAVLQGGGLGIFGDYFAAAENRFGGGLGQAVSGPMVAFAHDSIVLGKQLGMEVAGVENANAGRHTVNYLKRYTPLSSLWWGRLALERQGFDRLQEALDPEARQALRRRERRRRRDYGNDSWWRPGEGAPRRGPDFSNIAGGG